MRISDWSSDVCSSDLDDARAAAADGAGIGKRDVMGVAGRVLRNGDEAGNAAATHIFAANRVARTLGRDHEHVDIGARFDEAEMHVEAMSEGESSAGLQIVLEIVIIDRGLMLEIGREHDDVGPCGGFSIDRKSTRLN